MTRAYNTRNNQNVPEIFCRTQFYSGSFLPNVISEWNKLDLRVQSSESFSKFRSIFLKSFRSTPNSIFSVRDRLGLKLLTLLRLGLSHLREHKFSHNFKDTINPLCPCSLETESISHFFLCCHLFDQIRTNLKTELCEINDSILNISEDSLTKLLLYGNTDLSNEVHSRKTCKHLP